MNTNTSNTIAFDLTRFSDELTLIRPATRESFERYANAFDAALIGDCAGYTFRASLQDMGQVVRFLENPLDVIDLLATSERVVLVADTIGDDVASVTGYYLDYTNACDASFLFVPTDTFDALQKMNALQHTCGAPSQYGEIHYHTLSDDARSARALHDASITLDTQIKVSNGEDTICTMRAFLDANGFDHRDIEAFAQSLKRDGKYHGGGGAGGEWTIELAGGVA